MRLRGKKVWIFLALFSLVLAPAIVNFALAVMVEDPGTTGTLLFVWGPNVTNESWTTWNGNYSIRSAAEGVHIAPFNDSSFTGDFQWVEVDIVNIARGMNTSACYLAADRTAFAPFNRHLGAVQAGTLYHAFNWNGLADSAWNSSLAPGSRTDDVEGIYTLSWSGLKDSTYYSNYSLNNNTPPNAQTRKLVIDRTAPVTSLTGITTAEKGDNGWNRSVSSISLLAVDPVITGQIYLTASSSTITEYGNAGVNATEWTVTNGAVRRFTNTTGNSSSLAVGYEGIDYVTYWSRDNVWNVESPHSEIVIKVDTHAPESAGSALTGTAGSGGWYTAAVAFDLNASDASGAVDVSGVKNLTYVYSHNGGVGTSVLKQASELPCTITDNTQGTSDYYFYASDYAGNNGTMGHLAVKIDSVAPSTSFVLTGDHPASRDWNATYTNIELMATDATSGAGSTRYMVTNGLAPDTYTDSRWQAYTSMVPWTTEGVYNLYYYSTDNAGNKEAIKACASPIRIDRHAPATTIAVAGSAPLRAWNNTPVSITFNAADGGSGVWYTRYNITDSASAPDINAVAYWSNYSGIPVTHAIPGVYNVYYYSTDNASNSEGISSATIRIDTIAPETTLDLAGTHPVGKDWNKSVVHITLTPSDAGGSNVAYTKYMLKDTATKPSLADSGWTTYGGKVTYNIEGTHYLFYYSADNAGNLEGIISCACPILIDTSAPSIPAPTITGTRGTNGWNTSLVTVTYAPYDTTSGINNTWYRYYLIGTYPLPDNTSGNVISLPADGNYTIEYYADSNSGNLAAAQLNARIDRQVPATAISMSGDHPAGTDWNATYANFTFTPSDSGSGVWYTRYNVSDSASPPVKAAAAYWTNITDGTYVNFTTEGIHYIHYYSTDSAGNGEPVNTYSAVRIDKTAPLTTPTITGSVPARVWNNTPVSITLSASDAGSGVLFTRYNISDSITAPDYSDSADWTDYTGATIVYSTAGVHYVHYYSTDATGNRELIKYKTIQIDYLAPTTSLGLAGTHPAGKDWNSTAVKITLTPSDTGGSGIAYTRYMLKNDATTPMVTDSGWSDYSGVVTYPTEGTHYLFYYSVDNACNPEAIIACPCPIRIDSGTPAIPQPTIAGTRGTDGWNTTLVTLTFSLSSTTSGINNTWYRYYFQDADPLSQPGNTSGNVIALPADGNYTVEYYVDSNSGNLAAARLNVKIDTRLPLTSNTTLAGTPGTNGWYTTPVSFNIMADDSNGVAEVSGIRNMTYVYNHNGGGNISVLKQASALPWHVDEATEGVSTYYFYSWDKAGNNGTAGILTIKIDTRAPDTAFTINGLSGYSGWNRTNVSMILTPSDYAGTVISGTYYRINGIVSDPFAPYTGPVIISGERNNTVEYYSMDEAGNKEDTHTRYVLIDRTPPAVSVAPNGTTGSNGWFTSNVTVNLTAADNVNGSGLDRINYSTTGLSSFATYGSNISVTSEGVNTIYYYSTDKAGNREPYRSYTVEIDRTPPVSSNSTTGILAGDGWYTSDVNVALSAIDAGGSGYNSTWYRINGGDYTPYEPFQLTTVGNNVIDYYSVDNAGNNETPQHMQIKIGKTLPQTNCTLDGTKNSNGAFTSDVIMNLTATEDGPGIDYINYSLNNGQYIKTSGNFVAMKLTGGTYDVKYYAVDKIGRRESTNSITVIVDKIPPVTTATKTGTMGTNGWYRSNVTMTLAATDSGIGVDYVRYSLNGGSYMRVNGSSATISVTDNGTMTIRYGAVDKAGNTETPAALTVKIDKAPPATTARVVSGTLLGNTSWYTTNVTLSLASTDSASGAGYIVYNINSSANTTIAGNAYNIPIMQDGNLSVMFYGIDLAGNAEVPQSFNVSIDRNPLVTSCNLSGATPGNDSWYPGKVTARLTATDRLSEVNYTEYSLDNVNWNNYTGPFEYGNNGIATLYYRSRDVQGYVEPVRTTPLKIDLTDPQVLCTLSGTKNDQGRFIDDVIVTLSASDQSGIMQIQQSRDCYTWNVYTGPFSIPQSSSVFLYYRAWDGAGHSGTNSTWIYFLHDAGTVTPTPTPTPTPGPDQIATITPEPTGTITPVPSGGPTSFPTFNPDVTPVEITPGYDIIIAFAGLIGALAIIKPRKR